MSYRWSDSSPERISHSTAPKNGWHQLRTEGGPKAVMFQRRLIRSRTTRACIPSPGDKQRITVSARTLGAESVTRSLLLEDLVGVRPDQEKKWFSRCDPCVIHQNNYNVIESEWGQSSLKTRNKVTNPRIFSRVSEGTNSPQRLVADRSIDLELTITPRPLPQHLSARPAKCKDATTSRSSKETRSWT